MALMDGRDAYLPPPRREPPAVSRRSLLRLGFTPRARADIDFDGVTERVRRGWETGASEALLRGLEPVAAAAADLADVMAGERVLDAGAGDGNVALACRLRGAEVAACDLSDAMVERGRLRCVAEWRQGDVQALPYPDASFDLVISTFGAALAPRGRRTARELVRVLRPGGRLVLAAWTPKGLPGALDEHVALPDGVHPPTAWADEEIAGSRLAPGLERLGRRVRTVALAFPSPDAMFDAFTLPYGLEEEARAALRPAFDRLLAAQNNRPPAAEIDARYVLHLGHRPE